jgi:flagellar biosynthetic protein FliP
MRHRWVRPALAVVTALVFVADPAQAQQMSINLGDDSGSSTSRMVQLIVLMTVLSVAPSVLMMITSFTRIIVVLGLLRHALGTQSAPPNMVMASLALFLTGFIMAPVFQQSYEQGIRPLIDGHVDEIKALELAAQPFHGFMIHQVRDSDLKFFLNVAKLPTPKTLEAMPYRVLVPAFMISELRRAFEIGFLVFLPFLIIDMVVASLLMSMGMMMLPPVMISMPFKLIFFVMVDGWVLIAGSLVQSFGAM